MPCKGCICARGNPAGASICVSVAHAAFRSFYSTAAGLPWPKAYKDLQTLSKKLAEALKQDAQRLETLRYKLEEDKKALENDKMLLRQEFQQARDVLLDLKQVTGKRLLINPGNCNSRFRPSLEWLELL